MKYPGTYYNRIENKFNARVRGDWRNGEMSKGPWKFFRTLKKACLEISKKCEIKFLEIGIDKDIAHGGAVCAERVLHPKREKTLTD
jgi:hypothetical protein